LKEGRRLRVLRILGTDWDKVRGEWRRLHKWELHDLYASPRLIWVIKSNRMRWVGHVARLRYRRVACRTLVGKLEGKRPFGRPRRRWEDNIKMDLQEMKLDLSGLGRDTGGGLLCTR
jgi:hypothetical protein